MKVGKTAPKSNTYTDASFVSKTIHLPSQNIASSLNSTDEDSFNKHLALCNHHSSSTRKEALLYLQSHVPYQQISNIRSIVNSISPLILDTSASVRDTLLELFKTFNPVSVEPHSSLIMLYVHSAMTHLTPEIRAQSTQFLDYLIDVAPQEISRLSFIKTMNCFFPLFGWPLENSSATALNSKVTLASSTVTTGLSFGAKADKTKLLHLQSLEKLLILALQEDQADVKNSSSFHSESNKFLLTTTPNPYLGLELFIAKNSNNDTTSDIIVTEDLDERMRIINDKYKVPLTRGLQESAKEGGQVGRVAKSILTNVNSKLAV